MTCDNVKTCETCIHHVKDFYDIYVYELKCRRLQTKSCSLLYKDTIIWSGPILSCESEREIFLTLRERIFGSNKNKCGKDGKFYIKL